MSTHQLHTQHQRLFQDNRYVYPVLSRRAGGISIGVNLNPDKVCNFDCIYCQVDRKSQSESMFVELGRMLKELDEILTIAASGELFLTDPFRQTPLQSRRLNDIAFSGDGEPTTYKNFDQIVASCAEVKRKHGLDDTKMVLITNASMLHRPHVKRGLRSLDENNGQIWAKLEAGTEDYFKLVERTPIPFQQVLQNITDAARLRPLVIQSLFMKIENQPPTPAELSAFCERLVDITSAGGKLSLVQIYTVARRPAEDYVAPLDDSQIDAIVELVRERTNLPAIGYYGASCF